MKSAKFLEGFLFRPQGKPMAYPYTVAAKISQTPIKFLWREASQFRFLCYGMAVVLGIYWQLDKSLTGPENKRVWKEKREHDAAHHRHEMEKIWEVRT